MKSSTVPSVCIPDYCMDDLSLSNYSEVGPACALMIASSTKCHENHQSQKFNEKAPKYTIPIYTRTFFVKNVLSV